MSQFGLTIWMYDQTKSALAMGMMQVFFITPFLLISPLCRPVSIRGSNAHLSD